MIDIIKESLKITNDNLIIATPLILFSLISTLYMIFSSGGNSIGTLFSVILFFLMLSAFLSGWFYMIAKVIKEPETNNKDKLIVEFPSGVGEYFLVIIGMLIFTLLLSSIIVLSAVLIGKKYIGSTGISQAQIIAAASNIETMKNFANSLTNEQLIKINQWNLFILMTLMFNYFILMFYNPAIFFKKKNPFIAFFVSLKDLFGRKFFKNLTVFLLITVAYMFISILSAFLNSNIFLHFIFTLINFYYITFIAVFVFNYYYSNFAKIGGTIDKTV